MNPLALELNDALEAGNSGIPFYIGNDKVWLSEKIPASFITLGVVS